MVVRNTVDAAVEAPVDEVAEPGGIAAFGDEFRELARQRRFVREAERAVGSLSGGRLQQPPTAAPTPSAPAAPSSPDSAGTAAAAAVRRSSTVPPRAGGSFSSLARKAVTVLDAPDDQRISGDAAAMLAEMSRLADRVVESREALGAARARAERAEGELASVNDRMMAARALVHEAQRRATAAAERTAWLEGRNQTLQDALELAVNASPLQRWKWRRRMTSQATAAD